MTKSPHTVNQFTTRMCRVNAYNEDHVLVGSGFYFWYGGMESATLIDLEGNNLDSGYYILEPDGEPQLVVMAGRVQ